MKAIKALKKLARIEGLLSNVIERCAANDHNIQAVLDDAKEAVIRAKAAVGLQESSAVKKTSVNAGKPNRRRQAAMKGTTELPSQATLEPSTPKRKLSKAGRAAIVAALKKRWALKRAEAAKAQAPTKKKSVTKKSTAKIAVVKAPSAKAAKIAPVKRAAAPGQPNTEAAGAQQ
jgi:hypothetical protein